MPRATLLCGQAHALAYVGHVHVAHLVPRPEDRPEAGRHEARDGRQQDRIACVHPYSTPSRCTLLIDSQITAVIRLELILPFKLAPILQLDTRSTLRHTHPNAASVCDLCCWSSTKLQAECPYNDAGREGDHTFPPDEAWPDDHGGQAAVGIIGRLSGKITSCLNPAGVQWGDIAAEVESLYDNLTAFVVGAIDGAAMDSREADGVACPSGACFHCTSPCGQLTKTRRSAMALLLL